MLAPTPASPESAGMSKAALDRIEAHLKSRYHRCRPLSRHPAPGLSPRQGGAQRGAGLCRCRAQGSGQGRHHLPHLFDDQADHERGLHDAGRGRQGRARRARPQIHPGMEGSRRVRRRQRAELPDAGRRRGRCRSSISCATPRGSPTASSSAAMSMPPIASTRSARHGAGKDARRHDRGPRQDPAGVLARRGLELFGFHRRARLSHRQDFGQAVRAVPEGAHLRSARHDRHRFPRAGREGASLRRLLFRTIRPAR